MKEKINEVLRESDSKDIDEKLDEIPVYTNLSFALDSTTITFRNVDLKWLSKIDSKSIIIKNTFMFNWYSYGAYDRVRILEDDFIITLKTQKKIELVRANK